MSTVWLWQLKNEGKPKEMSGKGRTSYSQTITVSESRWAFLAGYSEFFFLKMLTEGHLGQLGENFSVVCVVVLYGDYAPITQTLFLLLLGNTFHLPSSPAVTRGWVLPGSSRGGMCAISKPKPPCFQCIPETKEGQRRKTEEPVTLSRHVEELLARWAHLLPAGVCGEDKTSVALEP